jgi:hypothetical protein
MAEENLKAPLKPPKPEPLKPIMTMCKCGTRNPSHFEYCAACGRELPA